MKRNYNFTGRKKIDLKNIQIILNRTGDVVNSFDAQLDLNKMDLPATARIVIEAYHRADLLRFDFGTIAQINKPANTDLSAFSNIDHILFRILVEEGDTGSILAAADRVKAVNDLESESQKKSIMPVQFKDLGQQIWVVSYDGDQPILMLNSKVPSIKEDCRHNPAFFFFVFPPVIRDILSHIFLYGNTSVDDDPDEDWQKDWITFSRKILPNYELPENANKDDKLKWINLVIEEFCASNPEVWKRFLVLEWRYESWN